VRIVGIMSVTGEADGEPAKAGVPLCDVTCAIYAALGAAAALAAATVIQVRAANDKFTFPDGFDKGVEYLTVDKPNKQVHVFYAAKEAIAAAKAGKPMPDGTVFVGVHYNAKLGADGNPVKDANGRFIKDTLRQYAVMRKEKGWGTEYPENIRNGEWEYQAFTAAKQANPNAKLTACFECHKPLPSAKDFLFSYDKMAGK